MTFSIHPSLNIDLNKDETPLIISKETLTLDFNSKKIIVTYSLN